MTRLVLAFLIPAVSASLLAQLKVDVQLVNVVATVTDSKGRYISDLTANDFILTEDGAVQTISHLSQSNEMPVSMGVVLDTSGSMERKIATATSAVERFLRMTHEDDDIFLLAFSNRPDLRQDFTNDREKLGLALRRITVGGSTSLYDALDYSLRKIKRGKYDKRAVLLISDGEDTSSEATFDEVTIGVRESELLVYCLGISPASRGVLTERTPLPNPDPPIGNPPGGGRRGPTIGFPIPGIPIPFPVPNDPTRDPRVPRRPYMQMPGRADVVDMNVLNTLADASGGKAWLLSGNWTDNRGREIQRVLDEIAAELRNQYSLGYYPSHPMNDGKWHRIEIRTKNPDYRVRSRKEYFGK